MKKNCMRTTATQTDRSRNSATITSPNSGGIPQKSQQQSQFPQKVSNNETCIHDFVFICSFSRLYEAQTKQLFHLEFFFSPIFVSKKNTDETIEFHNFYDITSKPPGTIECE